jgi:hypothetical protein
MTTAHPRFGAATAPSKSTKLTVSPLAILLVLVLASCSPTLATPSRDSGDPSSPVAEAGASPLQTIREATTPKAATTTNEHKHQHAAGHDHPAPPMAMPGGSPDHAPHGHGDGDGDGAPPASPMSPAASSSASTAPPAAPAVYACPMHPDVRANAPGQCPRCGMKLELTR